MMVGNIFTGKMTPASASSDFFSPKTGYTESDPERSYADIVDVYRLVRSGDNKIKEAHTERMKSIGFEEWLKLFQGAGVLPEWWKPRHKEELMVYTRENNWGRLNREVGTLDMAVRAIKRMLSYGMMIEKVMSSMKQSDQ